VPHHSHGVIEPFGKGIEGAHGVVPGPAAGRGCGRLQPLARVAQQFAGGWFHVLGADTVKRNAEMDLEEGILIGGNHSF